MFLCHLFIYLFIFVKMIAFRENFAFKALQADVVARFANTKLNVLKDSDQKFPDR